MTLKKVMDGTGRRALDPPDQRAAGGFTPFVPSRADMRAMAEVLRGALTIALATVEWWSADFRT